ncbi:MULTISPECIES: hypothetical protein [unclassified Curtobacterium]|jgi:hypothetical protein|uniref:hypothetical protein n=1 Tax=unclassified Curtobacterium TaxID=257496 RepID=UPI0028614B5A|nr:MULTISPECIES: hypothetical protein [unclassified Curtobacterium]MDR6172517.1 hypothetical protein [Curtobacterium sp. SORGH_AS_0776]MDR6571619.1 hypothetical protein [Curtobacterium sp. 320]
MTAGSRAERSGAPSIGPAVPAWTIGALGLVAGVVGSVVVIGASGWLVVAVVLAAAAAVLPRGPFAALLVGQLALAGIGGTDLPVLLLTTHLVLATSLLWAWTPRTARVQLRALLPSALRFVAVQVGSQAVAFVVVALLGGSGPVGGVWLAIAGTAALLALAIGLFVPTLLRAGDDAER